MTISPGPTHAMPARAWLEALQEPAGACREALVRIYGEDPTVLAERVALLRRALTAAASQLDDAPIRLFRAPGRINLRGMHVDTHGGYLNLMTHQREIVLACTPSEDARVHLVHAEAGYAPCSFDPTPLTDTPAFRRSWAEFLESAPVKHAAAGHGGEWTRYAEGAALSIQHRFPRKPLKGLSGVIASDLPQGAALSSSAALCVVCCIALLRLNDLELPDEALIEAAQDAEWYTGSRCGIADQAAIILGTRGEVVHAALQPGALDTAAARRVPLPGDARILVVNSHTSRSISGPQQLAYTRNRFAYSMAVAILHHELARLGAPAAALARMRGFAALTPQRLKALPGAPSMYSLLKAIPERIDLEAMRVRYELPGLDAQYATWFGSLAASDRPQDFHLRGPLLFGLAESERARLFADFLRNGDLEQAGDAMTIGHEGDRVVTPDGAPVHYPIGDAQLDALEAEGVPLWQCPGAYGASSPALDALVDTALEAGALGACLTGAGIAGTVLALCRDHTVEQIATALRQRLATQSYAGLARLEVPLTESQLMDAVVVNQAPHGGCEIQWNGAALR